MTRRIAVAGIKGGCGRTTVAVNLAAALAMRGNKILLVDLDPKADATEWLGLDIRPEDSTVYELLLGMEENRARAVAGSCVEGLHVIPSERRLYGAELELATEPGRERVLARLLQQMELGYDYVIVDNPSNFGLLALNSLCACHEALAPVIGSSQPAAVDAFVEILAAVNSGHPSSASLAGFIPNMMDKRAAGAARAIKKIEERHGRKMVRSRIRLDARLPEAEAAARPVQVFAPKSNAAYDFEVLADDIMAL